LQADLAEVDGVDKLYAVVGNRPVEALLELLTIEEC